MGTSTARVKTRGYASLNVFPGPLVGIVLRRFHDAAKPQAAYTPVSHDAKEMGRAQAAEPVQAPELLEEIGAAPRNAAPPAAPDSLGH